MVLTSANQDFLTGNQDDFTKIADVQFRLASQMKVAVLKSLQVSFPDLDKQLAILLCVKDDLSGTLGKSDEEFSAATSTVTKLSNMNLSLLFDSELQATLGHEVTSQFQANFMLPLVDLLTKCAAVAEWLRGKLV